jgi:hypothetical protein
LVNSCNSHLTEAKNRNSEPTPAINLSKADSLKMAAFWQMAMDSNLKNKSTQEIELSVANWFLATPYWAGTLDQNKQEQLVINFQGLDCVTYVENVVALAQTIKSGNLDNSAFFQHLKTLRYRDGKLDGYASRLHYFTEWLLNNQQKGILTLVSDSLGDADFSASVNILSKNKDKNAHLADSAVLAKILASEIEVSKSKLRYITKQHLPAVEESIQDGDIIAISTSIKGLDIVHTGIAIRTNNRLFLMHASSTLGKVVVSNVPLVEYLRQKPSFTGVLVARLIGN